MADPAPMLPIVDQSGSERRDQSSRSNNAGMTSPVGEPRRPPLGWCPAPGCLGNMETDTPAYDERLGLDVVRCDRCGYRGMQSREGVMLLFRSGYEYQFSYGPSVETISVVLSSGAVNLWATHDVTPDQLAIYTAEWALLRGIRNRPIRLMIDQDDFTDFYLYFTKQ